MLLLGLFAGCATGYQPLGLRGGYTDVQLAERVFEVRYFGNAATHSSAVEAYAMRRAAEITTARGFAGFTEVENRPSTQEGFVVTGGVVQTFSKHTLAKRIYLLTADEMRATPTAIDARMVLANWGVQVPRPAPTVTPPTAAPQSPVASVPPPPAP